MTPATLHDQRVLVLMPTVRDGERTRAALATAGLECDVCADMADLCRRMTEGAAVALLTEEALTADRAGRMADAILAQPPWSDFPLVVLAREGTENRPEVNRETMNISLVERPIRIRSLLSMVKSALRSRRRQYEVRDHLLQHARQAAILRDQEERLQFALSAGRLGSWTLDLATGQMECSPRCKENFGRPAQEAFSYQDLFDAMHPDDRERVGEAVRRAIDNRTDYDAEYRNIWPDGAVHWVMVRGRATYRPDGTPARMTGVSLDMTDRRRDEDALRDADRKKDDFLALLAHELRNPLAPIRNGLQVIRYADTRAVREQSQNIMERQLGHMVRLIDDLLDISRINRGKMELRLARISLAEAVENAIETARPAIEKAGHELEVSLPAGPVMLDADLTRLAQVFGNLLTNSAKYTPAGGRIRLTAERDGGQVKISVRDTGIGIPPEALPKIFDMFSQVDRSIERSTGGLGIGLALVHGLVEMHGGTATAASEGPGQGSEFTIRLPVAAGLPTDSPQAGRNSPEVAPNRRILVVDDNRDSAESMAMMLQLLGNDVTAAHDGIEAVEKAGEFRPQIILMDVGMPRLNGYDATRRIREHSWGRDVTVIALTGWGQDGDKARSKAAGCDGHLVKPVSLDDLTKLLTELTTSAAKA
ncbi:ATP-binding response regulator [Zavarzinella formosa]|uniref:ATP-binding response regulator n=1 Tax=Zavarzinella formosa TaxID=360055 RepID=UPI00031F37CC|nr:ATP-binding protein [Zavarzinella formosa]